MYKSYTIKAYKCTQVAPKKGHIKYLLEDDQGNQRTVSAMATLGIIKKIKSIRPINFRETPLIEILANSKVNEIIEIDFSDFNNRYPRVASNKKSNVGSDIYKELSENYSGVKVSFDPLRVLQLFIIAIAGLAVLTWFRSLI